MHTYKLPVGGPQTVKCGVYLRVAFISLEVDVEGGVYSRAVLNRVNAVVPEGG